MAKHSLQRASAAPWGGDVDLDRDRALVLRCQGGDGAAFAELYTEYQGRLHRFCTRLLLDRDEADEVTQEAFLRAWRALPSFSGKLRFYPWLTVIAKNLCIDLLRRRARFAAVQDLDRADATDVTRPDPFSTTMSSEDAVMAAFDGSLANEALMRLSERHRTVLRFREEFGLSYQEIAAAQGVELTTIETLLWRARQALKREYAALSGSRVLAGLLVGGAALQRLAQQLKRRAAVVMDTAARLSPRDWVAAGAVTVALATVSAAPSAPPSSTSTPRPTTVPTAPSAGPQGTGTDTGLTFVASSLPQAPAANDPPSTVATGAPSSSASAIPSPGPSTASFQVTSIGPATPSGQLPSASSPVSQVTQLVTQASEVPSQVPHILNQATSTVTGTAGAIVTSATLLRPSPVSAPLSGVLKGLVGT